MRSRYKINNLGDNMKIVSLANLKGGSGKSTHAINIADGLGLRGLRVVLCDLDEDQETVIDWSEINDNRSFDIKLVDPEKLGNFIDRNKNDYDFAILDCPPAANRAAAYVVRYSDLVIMPVMPSMVEVWALRRLNDLILDRQVITDGLPIARIMLSRCRKRTKLLPKVINALNDPELQLPSVMNSGTTFRQSYIQTISDGETVYINDRKEYGNDITVCIEQIEAIVSEILEISGDQS